jgi:glutamine amidotransferase
MNAGIFDYGAGNLHSLAKAIVRAGASVSFEQDPVLVARSDIIVLPGVGAFGPAAERLAPGLAAIRDAVNGGTPCLGVCLGMQLLFDSSEEGPGHGRGLGIFPGPVTRLRARRVPQIGWNTLSGIADADATRAGLTTAYFANGFACRPVDPGSVTAWSEHESDVFPAIVRRGRILGTQFHPEKSSDPGLRFIRLFIEDCKR